MDICFGIHAPILFALVFISSGVVSSQLYLQPAKQEHGYFTDDSFFITCFTTDETIDQLRWTDFDGNDINEREGRVHIQPADGDQQGLRLVFTNVEREDAGSYTCSDVHHSVSFDLIVYRSISFSDTARVQHSPEGETGVVICNVKSDPLPVVNWYFNGTKIDSDHKYTILENHGLTIRNLSRSDAGIYKCKAFVITPLSSQVNEMDIMLHVQYSPEILPEQKNVSYARIGSQTNITCHVSADPSPMFQWIRDEETLHNSSDHMIFNTNNCSILQMTVDDPDQLGEYVCRASNTFGWKEVAIELRQGNVPFAPKLSIANEDQGVVKLNLKAQDDDQPKELKVTGFKIEYVLSPDPWDMATVKEFDIGEPYLLKNMSYSSDYVLRAAARNAAGYSDYSEEVAYKTHSLQVASVIASGALGMFSSSSVLFLSIIFFRMF